MGSILFLGITRRNTEPSAVGMICSHGTKAIEEVNDLSKSIAAITTAEHDLSVPTITEVQCCTNASSIAGKGRNPGHFTNQTTEPNRNTNGRPGSTTQENRIE